MASTEALNALYTVPFKRYSTHTALQRRQLQAAGACMVVLVLVYRWHCIATGVRTACIPVVLIQVGPWGAKFPGSGTEISPVKNPHTHIRTKPLALASGQGRYVTVINTPKRVLVSCVRWGMAVICHVHCRKPGRYKFGAVWLLKRFRKMAVPF